MAKANKKSDVTAEVLSNLKTHLRGHDLGWVDKLCDQMKKSDTIEKKMKKQLNNTKLYNVFNNIVRDNAWRVLVIKEAKILLATYDSQFVEAVKQ